MLPMRTILHPTDFSEHSEAAFRLACALARDRGARLLALPVVPLPLLLEGPNYSDLPPEAEHASLWHRLEDMRSDSGGLALEVRVTEGDPASEIVRVARTEPCDLVVMGTQGRTGLGRLLMGSVAEQVVRRAACPVLTVNATSARVAHDGPPAAREVAPVP